MAGKSPSEITCCILHPFTCFACISAVMPFNDTLICSWLLHLLQADVMISFLGGGIGSIQWDGGMSSLAGRRRTEDGVVVTDNHCVRRFDDYRSQEQAQTVCFVFRKLIGRPKSAIDDWHAC